MANNEQIEKEAMLTFIEASLKENMEHLVGEPVNDETRQNVRDSVIRVLTTCRSMFPMQSDKELPLVEVNQDEDPSKIEILLRDPETGESISVAEWLHGPCGR